ncbi:hypothetical protein PIB30_053842 [Stylosanthes scabra]|uniref:Uncharacterized protein n=1 Tax=Stylosanthes scabra TaxID=79078 RepID=A0ABU6VGS6_9FABA|nr:hypothetical protein [Stylosanthes scabra]
MTRHPSSSTNIAVRSTSATPKKALNGGGRASRPTGMASVSSLKWSKQHWREGDENGTGMEKHGLGMEKSGAGYMDLTHYHKKRRNTSHQLRLQLGQISLFFPPSCCGCRLLR